MKMVPNHGFSSFQSAVMALPSGCIPRCNVSSIQLASITPYQATVFVAVINTGHALNTQQVAFHWYAKMKCSGVLVLRQPIITSCQHALHLTLLHHQLKNRKSKTKLFQTKEKILQFKQQLSLNYLDHDKDTTMSIGGRLS